MNSNKAPPAGVKTIPIRSVTTRIPNLSIAAALRSHSLQVAPKKSALEGASSENPSVTVAVSGPYQPIAEAFTTV